MIVHRLLDAFFRTLDAVDAARERVDQLMGREPRPDPWAMEWPPVDADPVHATPPNTTPPNDNPPKRGARDASVRFDRDENSVDALAKKAPGKSAGKTASPKKTESSSTKATDAGTDHATPAAKAAGKAAPKKAAAKKKSKKKAGRKPVEKANRKGSVDRVGKDLDSPRARAIWNKMNGAGVAIITDDADYDGKKVLGRTIWALYVAEGAGSEKGLTTNDISSLLHLSSGIEVFATNIGRACRDHPDLVVESEPDGRTKRFRLNAKGRQAASTVTTGPR